MLQQATWHMCQNTVEICITAPLSYSLVTGKEIVFGKFSFIDIIDLGAAC